MAEERYKLVDKSVSAHCCFSFTVIDATREDEYPPICETYEEEDANLIVQALNGMESLLQTNNYQQQVLKNVERWANHHGTQSYMTPEQVLSNIQHHPAILDITKSYADGKVPDTPNPWAKIAELEAALAKSNEQVASLQEALDDLAPYYHSQSEIESAVRLQLDTWNKTYNVNPDPERYEAAVKFLTELTRGKDAPTN